MLWSERECLWVSVYRWYYPRTFKSKAVSRKQDFLITSFYVNLIQITYFDQKFPTIKLEDKNHWQKMPYFGTIWRKRGILKYSLHQCRKFNIIPKNKTVRCTIEMWKICNFLEILFWLGWGHLATADSLPPLVACLECWDEVHMTVSLVLLPRLFIEVTEHT